MLSLFQITSHPQEIIFIITLVKLVFVFPLFRV